MKIPDYNKKIKKPTYLEMQEEIERLKEEYIMLQNASDEVEEEKDKEIERLKDDNKYLNKVNIELSSEKNRLKSIIKEVREKINNFDVFKEFTFPLMKRDVEQQVKSSIDYEWRKSIKEPILEILDKEEEQ